MKPFPGWFLSAVCWASLAVKTSAASHYVDANSLMPVAPYGSWSSAAHVIQDAIDAAVPGDEIIVTNSTYATGGKAGSGSIVNRVAVNKAITVRSVNGPEWTHIRGQKGCTVKPPIVWLRIV